MLVRVLKPTLGRQLIVAAVHMPMSFQLEVPLEVEKQVRGWHRAACEEIPRHPIRLRLRNEMVRELSVHEDVDEEAALRRQTIRHSFQQDVIILHVLHHLDGDAAIEASSLRPHLLQHWQSCFCQGRLRGIASDDAEVREAPLLGPFHDPSTLAVGIRNSNHKALREPLGHEKRARAPPATQVQNCHSILDTSAFNHLRQRRLLSFWKQLCSPTLEVVGGLLWVDAGRVLLLWTEPQVVELRRHLIVLLVCLSGENGDRHLLQVLDEGKFRGLLQFNATLALLTDFLGELQSDAEAGGPIRHQAAVQQPLRHGDGQLHRTLLRSRQQTLAPTVQGVSVEGGCFARAGGLPHLRLSGLAQANLPIVDVTGLKPSLTICEVVVPTPQKLLVEALSEGAHLFANLLFVCCKALAPLVQRLRVRKPNRERRRSLDQGGLAFFARAGDLLQGDQVGAREDTFTNEVRPFPVSLVPCVGDADRLDGDLATRLQTLVDGSEVSGKEFVSDGLNHLTTDCL
mmetsp:Transcript_126314/g.404373  ORF Transcript_126314/g.404373 Transcript_126314/m.404373 type:complete len:513 (+) Transcript_126314:512-2050(+)